MTELIALRALQGLGAGGLIVTATAVASDVVSLRDRGRYDGLFGSVFVVSTLSGPLLGGFFVDNLSWRWIFYVNVPIGVAALVMIGAAFDARTHHVAHEIDYAGAALLAAGLAAIVLATTSGALLFAAAGIALLAAFAVVERHAEEPLLPLRLLATRVFVVSASTTFLVGFALLGSTVYMPLFLQIVDGRSPTTSGLLTIPNVAGSLVSSTIVGRLIATNGRYRVYPIAGTAVCACGLLLLSRLDQHSSELHVSLAMLTAGLGLGLSLNTLMLAVQNTVAPQRLGSVTSAMVLSRQVGSSVGTAAFGAIFVDRLHANLHGLRAPRALAPALVHRLPHALQARYVAAFAASLHPVFVVGASVATCGFLVTWFLRELPLRTTTHSAGGEAVAAGERQAELALEPE